jgi:CHAT domain-containing protein
LCSDRSSSLANIRAAALTLRNELFIDIPSTIHEVHLRASGLLGEVPLAVIFDSNPAGFGITRLGADRRPVSALVAHGDLIGDQFRQSLPALPSISLEVNAIQRVFPRVRVLRGPEVTGTAVRSSDADVLHFSGHAIPWSHGTALLVAPDSASPEPDERLGLFRLDGRLRAKLAVFSACSTAVSTEQDTVAPSRLAEAAFGGGAHGVLASLWNVDSEATTELMREFYQGLGAGNPPLQALRSAANALRSKKAFAHPYYWAAFAVYGPNI